MMLYERVTKTVFCVLDIINIFNFIRIMQHFHQHKNIYLYVIYHFEMLENARIFVKCTEMKFFDLIEFN